MKARPTPTDQLVKSVLANAGVLGAKELEAWKRPQDDIRRLTQRDYADSLRRQLTYGQIKELVQKAIEVWPRFNQTVLGPPSKGFFSRTADALQLNLKSARYTSLALYGFYVDRTKTTMTKPLIFVNSAHHAVAMGTAFCHEVGHHFCNEIAHSESAGIRFYFDSSYDQHLHDQGELSADVIVALAGYPQPAARKIFEERKSFMRGGRLTNDLIDRIRRHIEEAYGFDFSRALSPDQNLQYLAGMLHYAKLRAALLEEYDL